MVDEGRLDEETERDAARPARQEDAHRRGQLATLEPLGQHVGEDQGEQREAAPPRRRPASSQR